MSLTIHINDASKIDLLALLFQNMKAFSEHVNIAFSTTGMYIQIMDAGKVSVLEIRIPDTWFDTFTCSAGNVTLGINSQTLYRILHARHKGTTSIAIVYNNNENNNEHSDHLFIEMKAEDAFDRYFEVPLMELDTEIMGIPEVEYEVELGMPSSVFATLIGHLKTFGETLEFVCSEEKVELISKSQEQGKMSVVVGMDDLDFFSINEGCQMNIAYSLHHMNAFCAYSKLFKEIEIRINSEQPIRMDYLMDGVSVKYYLAPKMND